jgi:hypothetical protein
MLAIQVLLMGIDGDILMMVGCEQVVASGFLEIWWGKCSIIVLKLTYYL